MTLNSSLLNDSNFKEINLEALYHELLECPDQTAEEEELVACLSSVRDKLIKEDREFYQSPVRKKLETKWGVALTPTYFDWDSRPIYSWEYVFKRTFFPVHVALTNINGWEVSTVWIGIDMSLMGYHSPHSPLIFETMIFPRGENMEEIEEFSSIQDRYSYLKEAEQGHQRICKRVENFLKTGISES